MVFPNGIIIIITRYVDISSPPASFDIVFDIENLSRSREWRSHPHDNGIRRRRRRRISLGDRATE